MTRAAFLPTPGDPFLLSLWFKYYARWWQEVDKLYVYVNSDSPPEVIQYIASIVDDYPNTHFIYKNHQIEHGQALKEMLEQSKEDLIMFIEDDGFIFKANEVKQCFDIIENGIADMVGSKRGSCSQWLYDRASEEWAIDNSGFGDHGPNFWPNFFFAKRKDLLKVSNFGARFWAEGEFVEPIAAVAPEDQAGDTFVEGSLQLRAMGLQCWYVSQYHGATDDEPDYMNQTNIWNPLCGWLHVGSLSSGFHGMLKPDYKVDTGHFSTDQEKLELERRIVFYQMAVDHAAETKGLPELKQEYQTALLKLINGYTLSTSRINRRIARYKEVMQ